MRNNPWFKDAIERKDGGNIATTISRIMASPEDLAALRKESTALGATFDAFAKAKDSLTEYQEQVQYLEDDYSKANRALNFLNGDTQDYVGALYLVESGLISENDAMKMVESSGIRTFNELKRKAAEQTNAQLNNNKRVEDSTKSKTSSMERAYNSFGDAATNMAYRIRNNFLRSMNQIERKAWETSDNMREAFREAAQTIGNITVSMGGGILDVFTTNIPHLAQGAVLPAGKPFLAMLGDQSSGKNLEAPESLIRQIVREETQNMSRGSATYTVPVQVGRQTLFTLVLDEAKMKQNQTGYNPFNMGG
jgi:ElaB/YqjD/DUF883 family membrane-anchored ribosome-binding protein